MRDLPARDVAQQGSRNAAGMKVHLLEYGCDDAYFVPTRYELVLISPDRWDHVGDNDTRCERCIEKWDSRPKWFKAHEVARYAQQRRYS